MSELIINGKALVRFTYDYIPSWNEALRAEVAAALKRRGSWIRAVWKGKGESVAQQFMSDCGPTEREHLIQKRAMVIVYVFRATEGEYDVHNVYTKALFDGFTRAKLWRNDDWPSVPIAIFMWRYMEAGDPKGQRFEVEIHELARVVINGEAQILPTGREVKVKHGKRKSN